MTSIYRRTRNNYYNITILHVYFYTNMVTKKITFHKLLIIIYFSCHYNYDFHKLMTFYRNLLHMYVKNIH